MKGKHEVKTVEENLVQKIVQLNTEIEEIKLVVVNIFDTIKTLNESNDYGSPEVIRRRISEICENTIRSLMSKDIEKELDKPLTISSSN